MSPVRRWITVKIHLHPHINIISIFQLEQLADGEKASISMVKDHHVGMVRHSSFFIILLQKAVFLYLKLLQIQLYFAYSTNIVLVFSAIHELT